MKVLIVLVCSLSALARASLEPAGYRPPGSAHLQSSYLPPSAGQNIPENHYIPSAVGSSIQPSEKFNNQVSNSYLLPSKNSPVPFTQYLPGNHHHSHHQNVAASHGNNFVQNLTPSNQYIPANQNENSFTRNQPLSDYLPPKPNQNRASGPSNAYLTPNVQSGHSTDGFYGQNGFTSTGHYSGAPSVNRHSKINQGNSGQYSLGHSGQHSNSGSSGYHYNAPENHEPAKYDFEYKVKDNYGNDYGHKESRNGENTQGVYTVLLPDGRRQIVHYEADSHGYRPTITYEETGSQSGYSNNQGYQY